MMYFFKRSFKYLKKKKGKTLLLGIIFLVISNFVLAGLLVQNASVKSQEDTRIKIGANITYSVNTEKILEDAGRGTIEGGAFSGIRQQMLSGLTISDIYTEKGGPTYSNFLKVIDSDYVDSYDLSLSVSVDPVDDIKEYSIETAQTADSSTNKNNNGQINLISGGAFTLKYFISSEPMDFSNDLDELVSGRFATFEEISNADKVVLISQDVADINSLELGDVISVSPIAADYSDAVIDYQIIGIYSTTQEVDQRILSFGGNSLLPQNTLYVPFSTITALGITEEDINDLVLTSNVIKLKDPKNIDDFVTESEAEIDFVYGTLDANNALFERLVGPIESLGKASSLIVIIIVIAGALIIGLITALTVNERKEEIGILLAIGEEKYKIVSQFVVEVLVIAVISFTLSIFTGAYIGQAISDSVLESDLLTQQEQTELTGPRAFGRGGIGTFNPGQQQPQIEQDTTIDITLSTGALAKLFGTGLLLSIISTMIPSLYVMRFNPKQILTNKTT